jgi:hypothetical protein
MKQQREVRDRRPAGLLCPRDSPDSPLGGVGAQEGVALHLDDHLVDAGVEEVAHPVRRDEHHGERQQEELPQTPRRGQNVTTASPPRPGVRSGFLNRDCTMSQGVDAGRVVSVTRVLTRSPVASSMMTVMERTMREMPPTKAADPMIAKMRT